MGITLKEMAEKNYKRGLWTIEMLEALLAKGKLTAEEVAEIKLTSSMVD